jgi:hypothetical protein
VSTRVNTLSLDYFKARSTPEPNTGCWLWDMATNRRGYGVFGVGRGCVQAHRGAFYAANGYQATNFVCHKCDTPACVNPEHLYDGTPSENLKDAYRKGRKGKIPATEIPKIRQMIASGVTHSKIAAKYGVAKSAIYWRINNE